MANAGAIRAGRAFVELFADDSKLVRGLKRAQAKLAAWGASITAMGKGLIAAGLVGLAPLAGATKLFSDMGSALQDASERTGIAVEDLSALQFAAEQSGASFEDLEKAIRHMQKEGFGERAEDVGHLADQIAALESPAQQTQLALEAFGKSGAKLLPMLKGGAAGLQAMTDEARAAGIVMSAEDAAAADKLGDSFGKLWTMTKFTAAAIGGALAPAAGQLFTDIMPLVSGVASWVKQNQALVVTAAKLATALLAIGAGGMVVGSLLSGLAGLGSVFGLALTAATALLSPVGLLTASLLVLGNNVLNFGEMWTEAKETATTAWGGIVNAVKAGDLELAMRVAWTGVKVVWAGALANLKAFWVNFTSDLVDNWHGTIDLIRAAWAGAMRAIVTLARKAHSVSTSLVGGAAAAGAAVGQGEVGDDFDAEFKRVAAENIAGRERRAMERAAAIAATQADVAAAKREFADAVADAARAGAQRVEAAARQAQGGMGIASRTGSDRTFGTFSALVAKMLGPNRSLDEKQLAEQVAMNKKLERLTEEVRKIRPLAFA